MAWPWMLALKDQQGWANWKFMVGLTTIWHAIWVIIANLAMWAVYHLELPFLEKYKVTSQPWPWKGKKEEWNKLMIKSIINTVLNGFITLPLI